MTHILAPVLAILLTMALPSHQARPADPFRVDNRPPTAVIVSRSATPVDQETAASPMLAALAGIVTELDPKDLAQLRRALGNVAEPDELQNAGTLAVLHMTRGQATARAEILTLASEPDPRYAVRTLDDPETAARFLDADVIRQLALHRVDASDAADFAPSRRYTFEGNGDPSSITLDSSTRRRAFRANYPELTRDLTKETLHARTPPGFDPKVPTGILVWVSPAPEGGVPQIFEPALDELGLVCVAATNAGNQRPLTDRLQLMLDAIETAANRMTLDPDRIYVTGMSGGGRCASILQIGMPELFAGAVPIVGLDSYHIIMTNNGATRWPAHLGKPQAPVMATLKQRRIRGITGDQDFNEPEMSARVSRMQNEGLNIRLDVIKGMAHVMPTPEDFATALRWVDEPRREAIAASIEAAQAKLESAEAIADPAAKRSALIEVTALAPWSEPAWEAAEQLGYARP